MLDQDKQGSKFRFHYSDAIDAHDSTTGLHPASQILNFRLQFRAIHTHTHTHTILRKGYAQHAKMPLLQQFRASDTHDSTKRLCSAAQNHNLPQFWTIHTHDLTKGLRGTQQNRNFTTVSRDRHARFYERVVLSTPESQFYLSFARSTRTILRRSCAANSKMSILLQFRTIHARFHERAAFSQAFSGPGRPSRHFKYFGKF